ncbi:hypothetical protein C6P42_001261 [Pichia californica]|nr:hypothetical protein C6P42_001261 [[Candida] californica]
MAAPPPPPPPPPPGMPPPMGSAPAMPKITPNRNALLGDIRKGKSLKHTETNDRSAPKVGGESNSSPSAMGGMGMPPFGGAPKLPKSNNSNSNSNSVSPQSAPAVPQLGDIFAGGMPKLKHISHPNSNTSNSASSARSTPEVPSGRPKRNSMNFSPNPPSIPAMPPPTTPIAPAIPSFNSSASKVPSGAPPTPSTRPQSNHSSPVTPSVPKQRLNIPANSHRRNESTNSMISMVSSKAKPKIPTKNVSERISSSSSSSATAFGAPPIPSSPPPIPGSAPPIPSFNTSSTSSAPSIPSFSAPKAPSLPTSSAPPPPPMAPTALPSGTPPPPGLPPPPSFTNATKANKPAANPMAGGLPFLAQINQRRNDAFVVDDNAVAKKSSAPTSAPKEQDVANVAASVPSAPSIPGAPAPSGNPMMDEILRRTHKSTPSSSAPSIPLSSAPALPKTSAPSVPAIPPFSSQKAPVLPSMSAPSAPAIPSAPAPSIPSFSAPKAPSLPTSSAPPPPPMAPTALPSGTPPPPGPPPPPSFTNATKANKPAANPMAGGLPFLAQINQRRNDAFVVDDNAVAKKSSAPTSAPKEQDVANVAASVPSATSIPSAPAPSGNPMMDEILRRTHKSTPSLSAPSIPSSVPPSLSNKVPSAPSIPPSMPPSMPISNPPSAPSIPPSAPPSLPTISAPPLPPTVPPDNTYSGNYNNDTSDTSSIFSDSTTTTSTFRKKAAPPRPPTQSPTPPAASTQYSTNDYTSPTKSQPRLSVDTSSLNLTSAPTISPKVTRPSYLSAVEDSTLFTNIRSKFGGSVFKHHSKIQSPVGYQQANDQIVQTQVAGNEIRKIDISAYTIAGSANGGITAASGSSSSHQQVKMESPRFRFLDQNELPKPHKFEGRIKLYPSGRGSSVPLDLSGLS